MANFFSVNRTNHVATPPTKNPQENSGGRLRAKLEKFGSVDAASGDILFTQDFKLSDVIHSVELINTVAFGANVTLDLGPYLPIAATGDTPVLSPISGGTAAEDRFASAVDVSALAPLSNPLGLWGESVVPVTIQPLWEALGYASLAAALVDIPGGRVCLGANLEGAGNPAASNVTLRIVYNAGD
jgi:hypothetical protein